MVNYVNTNTLEMTSQALEFECQIYQLYQSLASTEARDNRHQCSILSGRKLALLHISQVVRVSIDKGETKYRLNGLTVKKRHMEPTNDFMLLVSLTPKVKLKFVA